VTRLGGASVATGHKMLLGSWARIFRAWYPDGTGAYLAQHTFLLMFQTGVSWHFRSMKEQALKIALARLV